MKRLITLISLIASTLGLTASTVARIDPAFWYVGMRQAQLQLMVYGQGIREADVQLAPYTGVTLTDIVRLDSPNYLLLYLTLAPDTPPGQLTLTFKQGREQQTVRYELRGRDKTGEERHGFTSRDVLYMLMPDRFAQGRAHTPIKGLHPYREDRSEPSLRHGGDLEGIRQHLNYFTDLGVTALWLTPVLENNSPDSPTRQSTYHGYATTDYYRVDPRLGTNEEYRRLIDECHQKGLKLVMDMIFNHSGLEHPWVADRPSKDWYNEPSDGRYLQTSYKLTPVVDPYASQVDRDETVRGWFVPTMPDLNQRNPHVMRYLIQNSKWWIEYAGIDGIRMDTYPYADREAMAQWMQELEEEYPHLNVVGETWVTEPAYTAAWQKGSKLSDTDSHLPCVMDFAFYERINQALTEETDGWFAGLNRIYNTFVYDYLYPQPQSVMAFIENHDTDRFLRDGHNQAALRQALTLLLTAPRIPQLYYGTEVMMNGTKAVTDGDVRRDFPGGFPSDAHDCFTHRTAEESEMYNFLATLLHWRQTSKAVCEGTMTHFCPVNGCYVYARRTTAHTVLVILNGTDHDAVLPLQRYAEVIGTAQQGTDVATHRTVSLTEDLKLAPRESLILDL